MKGFAHEKARNIIFNFRYFFHDSGDHIADGHNTIFIEKPLVSIDTRGFKICALGFLVLILLSNTTRLQGKKK